MNLEYVGSYGLAGYAGIHLFRHPETKQGVFIAQELARLCGAARTRSLPVPSLYAYRLIGQELVNFKRFLLQQQLIQYQRCTRLSLLTESGLGWILGHTRHESWVRLGTWLVAQILPNLRSYHAKLYWQTLKSNHLQRDLHIFIDQGRLGIWEPELHALLQSTVLDPISLVRWCYIPGLHAVLWPLHAYEEIRRQIPTLPAHSQNTVAFLYEPGLYRYLQQIPSLQNQTMQLAWETEVVPSFHQMACFWAEIEVKANLDIPADSHEISLYQKTYSQAAESTAIWHLAPADPLSSLMSTFHQFSTNFERVSAHTSAMLTKQQEFLQEQQRQIAQVIQKQQWLGEIMAGQQQALKLQFGQLQAYMQQSKA